MFCFGVVLVGCVVPKWPREEESMHGRVLACSNCDVFVGFGFCEARGEYVIL